MSETPPAPYVSEQSILHLVGAQSAQRGKLITRTGAASIVEWELTDADGTRGVLTGTVQGTQPHPYTTVVHLKAGTEVRSLGVTGWEPYRSTCSCPVQQDCKHAAALLYVATAQAMRERLAGPRRGATPRTGASPSDAAPALQDRGLSAQERPSRGRPAPATPTWRELLGPLVHGGTSPVPSEPLAFGVELRTEYGGFGFSRFGAQPATLQDIREGASLHAGLRLLRPGTRENWIKGGLTWKKFQYSSPFPAIRSDHASLVSRIVRLQLAESTYGVDPGELLRLDSFTPDGWALLCEARRLGIDFVGQGVLSHIEWAEPVTAALDVRRAGAGLRLSTVATTAEDATRTDLRPAGPGGFIAVLPNEDSPQSARLQLAPAAEPVPEALRALFRRHEQVEIPAEETQDFLEDYTPQLRSTMSLRSTDGSVTFPDPVPPRLQLVVRHRRGDLTDLEWQWVYTAPRRVLPLHRTGRITRSAVGRDLDHEEQVLAEVRALWPRAFGADEATLHDVEGAAFVEHVLPRIATLPDVDVIEHGKRPGYQELTGTPHLRIVQVESPRTDRTDWFDLGFEITIGEHLVPFTAIFKALSQGRKSVLLPDKTYAKLDHPTFDKLRELLIEAESMPEWEPEAPAIGRHQVTFWEEFEDLADESATAVAWRRSVGALTDLQEIPVPAPPPGLEAILRPYQHEGFAWLTFLYEQGLGGILADDMGLGKTIQTLALFLHARGAGPSSAPPFLVVAPSSVLSVWESEAARFAPGLDLRVLPTTTAKRGTPLATAVEGADVVVTSYALLRLDQEEYTALDWQGLVLDEAQFVKNRTAKAHRAAAEVQAPFRLAITGTPMENSLTDLWSLLSLTAPGLFPSMPRFREEYVKPIEKHDGTAPARTRADQRMSRLRRRIRPFVLRRTKDVVATDLPEKQEQVVRVPLEPKHRRLYEQVLQRERQKLLGLVEDLDRNRFIVFRSLTLLRMLALDPAIVDQEHAAVPSSKLEALMGKLEEVLAEGHRVIVFSQFTSFLTRVAERLEQQQVPFSYLDGSTDDRAGAIASFREGELPVFLISLKAGGFGLTLTEADYVFLLDPWWNPAAEAQAVDRAHRIGQQRTVMVYRMVAENTIEEKVVALQERKAALFSSLTDGDSAFQSVLSAEDVRDLLRD